MVWMTEATIVVLNMFILHSAAWLGIVLTGNPTQLYNPHENPPSMITQWQLSDAYGKSPSSYATIVFNQLIYVFGGIDNGADITAVVSECRQSLTPAVFNSATNNTSYDSPLPPPLACHSVTKLMNEDGSDHSVIMCGGAFTWDNGGYKATSNCSQGPGDWTQIAPLPKPTYGAAMVTLSNRAFVFGGGDFVSTSFFVDSVYMYGENNIWVEMASMINATTAFGIATLNDTEAIICGGHTPLGPTAECYIYSVGNDIWRKTHSLSQARVYHSLVVFQDEVYCIGGVTVDGAKTKLVEVLYSDGWRSLPATGGLTHGRTRLLQHRG